LWHPYWQWNQQIQCHTFTHIYLKFKREWVTKISNQSLTINLMSWEILRRKLHIWKTSWLTQAVRLSQILTRKMSRLMPFNPRKKILSNRGKELVQKSMASTIKKKLLCPRLSLNQMKRRTNLRQDFYRHSCFQLWMRRNSKL